MEIMINKSILGDVCGEEIFELIEGDAPFIVAPLQSIKKTPDQYIHLVPRMLDVNPFSLKDARVYIFQDRKKCVLASGFSWHPDWLRYIKEE